MSKNIGPIKVMKDRKWEINNTTLKQMLASKGRSLYKEFLHRIET